MDRPSAIKALHDTRVWDVVIIGGGATGLGCAVDAAARGYKTLLIDQGDFAQGTSSRSTKLIHGGLRYLRQGKLALVREALRERGLLMRNAPHLVKPLDFVVPCHAWWERPFYEWGVRCYDRLAAELALDRSRWITRAETICRLPTIAAKGLRGGVLYRDAQFDDARLAIALALTFTSLGGTPLNYMRLTELLKTRGKISGIVATDLESGEEIDLGAKVVINATGAACDGVRQLDEPRATPMIAPSQGAHIVLDRSFLPGDTALMVPRTSDGRVLFAIPWHGRTLIGTTDTPVKEIAAEPRPLAAEIEFLLAHTAQHLSKAPTRADVLSCFAGVRPLVRSGATRNTATLSRDHTVTISPAGLVTIAGGKWTTYRHMAEDAVNAAASSAGLPARSSVTDKLPLANLPAMGSREPLHPRLDVRVGEIVAAARREMARTVADALSRRSRALLLDARASIEIAPRVAAIMAAELGRDESWQREQVEAFTALAAGYLPCG